jgi:hypothetical protein
MNSVHGERRFKSTRTRTTAMATAATAVLAPRTVGGSGGAGGNDGNGNRPHMVLQNRCPADLFAALLASTKSSMLRS